MNAPSTGTSRVRGEGGLLNTVRRKSNIGQNTEAAPTAQLPEPAPTADFSSQVMENGA